MKKSTDTFLRIVFIIAIFGAIGNYYYLKFKKPMAGVVKSEKIEIPAPPPTINEKPKPVNVATKEEINNKRSANLSILDLKESTVKIVVDFLKKLSPDITFTTNPVNKELTLKRVLIGPYSDKTKLIKDSAKIKLLNIDSLRLKIKGKYYIHVGSFSKTDKLKDLVNKLRAHNLKNIVFMDIKIPQEYLNMQVANLDETSLKKLTDFLDKNHIKYKENR
jgi:cell division septation protein DedD